MAMASSIPVMQEPQAISLVEYNSLIKGVIYYEPSLQQRWVMAETSDVRTSRGHCYMELIQKDERGSTVAKLGAVMWARDYATLDKKFADATGTRIASNMKVMVKVTANFHELYGLKLMISDINPEFTLGDMARLRREILLRLESEGVINNNKELCLPAAATRIAVISAAGAAGYGDFCKQLHANAHGIKFYTCLFSAVMQGVATVPSVMSALRRVCDAEALFDCVVLIRGGGATSELNSFDNLELARAVALCPLPVITGIGHERDRTVLDEVAALSVKTPTAAAELLIANAAKQLNKLDAMANGIAATVREALKGTAEMVARIEGTLPLVVRKQLSDNKTKLSSLTTKLPVLLLSPLQRQRDRMAGISSAVAAAASARIEREKISLKAEHDKVLLLSPQNTLMRGYSITTLNGKAVTSATAVAQGDTLTHRLANGTITTKVL